MFKISPDSILFFARISTIGKLFKNPWETMRQLQTQEWENKLKVGKHAETWGLVSFSKTKLLTCCRMEPNI